MDEDRRQQESRAQRRVHVAVVIAMGLIIAAWVILLPGQLRLAGSQGGVPPRWEAINDEPAVTFRESLAELRARLESFDTTVSPETPERSKGDEGPSPAVTRGTLPVIEERSETQKHIELLQVRLEAAQDKE